MTHPPRSPAPLVECFACDGKGGEQDENTARQCDLCEGMGKVPEHFNQFWREVADVQIHAGDAPLMKDFSERLKREFQADAAFTKAIKLYRAAASGGEREMVLEEAAKAAESIDEGRHQTSSYHVECARRIRALKGTALRASGERDGEVTRRVTGRMVEAFSNAPWCDQHKEKSAHRYLDRETCLACLRIALTAALSSRQVTAFDPDFNCPTHFAVGDPTCAACIAKQPRRRQDGQETP